MLITPGLSGGIDAAWLHHYLHEQFDDILKWHHGEKESNHRQKSSDDEMDEGTWIDRNGLHVLDKCVTIAEIGKRLDVRRA